MEILSVMTSIGFLAPLALPRREAMPQRFGMGNGSPHAHLLRHGHGLVGMYILLSWLFVLGKMWQCF